MTFQMYIKTQLRNSYTHFQKLYVHLFLTACCKRVCSGRCHYSIISIFNCIPWNSRVHIYISTTLICSHSQAELFSSSLSKCLQTSATNQLPLQIFLSEYCLEESAISWRWETGGKAFSTPQLTFFSLLSILSPKSYYDSLILTHF